MLAKVMGVENGLYFIIAFAAYLIGSLPTGYLAGKAKGIDIRAVGSGNIGATNAFRILGKKIGTIVLLVDALKGYAACAGLPWVAERLSAGAAAQALWLQVIAGVAVILGHNFTCWLKFKGGKGVATTAGVLLALAPAAAGTAIAIWIITALISRYVSLASIAAAASLPFAAWFWNSDRIIIVSMAILGVMAILKHRSNIRRLLSGTEHRIGEKKNLPK
jgi:acyl phosphate:glycerol-3-phosphate acyltransferase